MIPQIICNRTHTILKKEVVIGAVTVIIFFIVTAFPWPGAYGFAALFFLMLFVLIIHNIILVIGSRFSNKKALLGFGIGLGCIFLIVPAIWMGSVVRTHIFFSEIESYRQAVIYIETEYPRLDPLQQVYLPDQYNHLANAVYARKLSNGSLCVLFYKGGVFPKLTVYAYKSDSGLEKEISLKGMLFHQILPNWYVFNE
jgi:hypothetical protein